MSRRIVPRPKGYIYYPTRLNRAQKFDRFPEGKKEFFNQLRIQMHNASVLKVAIQDIPGYRFALFQCKVCKEYYWLTDMYSNLDYCPMCQIRANRIKHANALRIAGNQRKVRVQGRTGRPADDT